MGIRSLGEDRTLGLFEIAPGAVLLKAFASPDESVLLADLQNVAALAPFRGMCTPSGLRMSVAMTNCGALGWYTDQMGHRYEAKDPKTGIRWPSMPASFMALAVSAAREGGYPEFFPDACLVNRYAPGAQLSLHQDRDEVDFDQPIISVSLGLPATFLFGGKTARTSQSHWRFHMAMWSFGAGLLASISTASSHWKKALIRWLVISD